MLLTEVLAPEDRVENLEVSLLSRAWSCSCVTRFCGVIWTTLSTILSVVVFRGCGVGVGVGVLLSTFNFGLSTVMGVLLTSTKV